MRSAWRTRSRTVTSPTPSTLAWRATRLTRCGCRGASSGASSTQTMRSSTGTAPSAADSRVVLPAPVPPETRNASRAAMTSTSKLAASAAMAPAPTRAARSWVAGRSTRRDRHVPAGAIGGRTAWRRTVYPPAPNPASCPSTQGWASSSRRPAESANRCANRRTDASSSNRMSLRRNPLPSSTHTASGADTNTSVVPSAHSSGSRIPAPVSSVCSRRRLVKTAVSPSTPCDSARMAAATTPARNGPDSAASRSLTRSTNGDVTPPPAHPSRSAAELRARVGRRPPTVICAVASARRARAHRRASAVTASPRAAADP